MTTIVLSRSERAILSLGLKFVPTPGPITREKLFTSSLDQYFRRIRQCYHFDITMPIVKAAKQQDAKKQLPVHPSNHLSIDPSINPSSSSRPILKLKSTRAAPNVNNHLINEYIRLTRDEFENVPLLSDKRMRNTSYDCRMILNKMRNHPSIIIKPADKNLGITILDREWYVNEMNRQLNDHLTYRPSTFNAITFMMLNSRIMQITSSNVFCDDEKNYITKNPSVKSTPSSLYGTPKIHKLKNSNLFTDRQTDKQADRQTDMLAALRELMCRPIVSCVTYVTTPLSQWVDFMLNPLVTNISTVIKDSKSFVQMIESMYIDDEFIDDCILLVADISSLYTMIPTDLGIAMMRRFLNRPESRAMLIKQQRQQQQQKQHQDVDVNTIIDIIIKSLDLILKNNYIQFNGKTYLQVNGTAMGQSCAVVFANVFVYEIEIDMVNRRMNDRSLLSYNRFIDDVFAIITRSQFTQAFIDEINSLHPSMTFNCVTSSSEVEFLDVVVYKGDRYRNENRFDVRVHQKQINRYLYIPFTSFHTYHNKVGWIKAELMRYIRNTSSFDEYIKIKRLFFRRLRDRGYPLRFLFDVMQSVMHSERSDMLSSASTVRNVKATPLTFVTTYHQSIRHDRIRACLMRNWNLFQADRRIENVLGKRPIIGYRRSANLYNVLVRSTYTEPHNQFDQSTSSV
jgi:hypothetical protein